MGGIGLETLAWIEQSQGHARRAAVLLGAAAALSRSAHTSAIFVPDLAVHHDACELAARRMLGRRAFETGYGQGAALPFAEAIDYALGRQHETAAAGTGTSAEFTRRELEVANLVAEGLTNRSIGARLSISRRTAEAHIEHILTKLGFTSRTQIATWIAEHTEVH